MDPTLLAANIQLLADLLPVKKLLANTQSPFAGMKVWLGAAAALSGAGTLVYLLVRSSQRRWGNGTPSTTSESHSTKGNEDSQDASGGKDDSCERLNGHLPTERGKSDNISEMPSAVECHKDSKQQNLSERSLTPGEMCDVNAGVEQLSSNLDGNLCELVSAMQDKIVKGDNLSNTSTCEEENVQPQTDDKEISQPTTVQGLVADLAHTHDKHQQDARPGPGKDQETRECISTHAIEEKKVVTSSEKEIPVNVSNQETVWSDTGSSSLKGTACVSNPTETSFSLPEPVVEELSQCRISKPQCDPCCCEDRSETCHHTPASSGFTEFSNENYSTLNAQEATQKCTENENLSISPERHYTLTLKSNEENFSISGKHIHDPSPTEVPVAEASNEEQEGGAELNKDEPGTCIVAIEQREKVDEKQVPPSPISSSQKEGPLKNESVYSECSSAAGNDCCGESEAKEGTAPANTAGTVLEADDKTMQPMVNTALETPTPVQEQESIEEAATQDRGQSYIQQEIPQEQKGITNEQENTEEQQHDKHVDSAAEEEPQSRSSNNEKILTQELKLNGSEAEEKKERQEHSPSEQLALKEEQSSCSEQDVPKEQKEDHDEEMRIAEKTDQSEGKQSSIVQEEILKQEQNDRKNKATPRQKQSSIKQEARLSGKKPLEVTQKQEKESSNKQHKAEVEQEQTKSNKQVAATPQEQVGKEGDKKQKLTKEEEQAAPTRGDTKEQKESNKKQKIMKKQQQPSQREGTQRQKESNKEQKVKQRDTKSSHAQDTGMEKKEGSDNKQQVTVMEEQTNHKKEITSPGWSAEDQVTGDQTALSSPKHNNNDSGGKKEAVRSRGDSASADLDCDVGLEQDNLNCDSSSLVSR